MAELVSDYSEQLNVKSEIKTTSIDITSVGSDVKISTKVETGFFVEGTDVRSD